MKQIMMRLLTTRLLRRFISMYGLILIAPLLDIAPQVMGEWDMAGGVGTFTWLNFPLSVLCLATPFLLALLGLIAIVERCWRCASKGRNLTIASLLFVSWLFTAEGVHAEYVSLYTGNTWLPIELWASFLFGWGGAASVFALAWSVVEFKALPRARDV